MGEMYLAMSADDRARETSVLDAPGALALGGLPQDGRLIGDRAVNHWPPNVV